MYVSPQYRYTTRHVVHLAFHEITMKNNCIKQNIYKNTGAYIVPLIIYDNKFIYIYICNQ